MSQEQISPPDDAFIPYVSDLRGREPSLGVPKLLTTLKSEHPEWTVSEKRLRKAVQALAPAQNGDAGKSDLDKAASEHGLVATTGIDPSITASLSSLAPKVKVRMFGGEKGKGLVAREKILQGEVLWQEEPWVVSPSQSLYSALSSRRMCSQCFTLFGGPSPSLSVSCSHCDGATFCNRLCYSKVNSSNSHPDLLCPGLNPDCGPLWEMIHRSGGRHVETVAKIIAMWRVERELGSKGRAKEIEKRVWEGMARVSVEEREKEKKEWQLFGDLRRREWEQYHNLILQALNPSPQAGNYKAFQKTLTRIIKKAPTELSEEEEQRWLSFPSFLELLGLVTLNIEDSGGLYALHAHLNHSCEPNLAALNFPKSFTPPPPSALPCEIPGPFNQRGNTKLTIIARRTINPGEELTIPYVNFNLGRSDRRGMLRESYGFWCNCPKCVREQGKEEPKGQGMDGKADAEELIQKMKGMPGFENVNGIAEAMGHEGHNHGHGHDHGHDHGHVHGVNCNH